MNFFSVFNKYPQQQQQQQQLAEDDEIAGIGEMETNKWRQDEHPTETT